MAVNLSPIWGAGAQLLDNSGNVLSGGKIYTYAAGTTTPVTTFTSNTGITANSNPIVLNSAGRVPYEIWLTDGQNYKFVLKDSNDVLIGTWDNLSGINSNFIAYTNQQEIQTATAGQTVFNLTTMNYLPATNSLSVFVDGVNQYGPGASYAYEETDSNTVTFTSGLHDGAEVKFTSSQIQNAGVADASQITYDPPFTDSVPTNVELKLAQTVSVKDFGAVGDGVTDDTTAIQNALTAAESVGGATVFVPATTDYYKITGTLEIPNGVVLQGDGYTYGGTSLLPGIVYTGTGVAITTKEGNDDTDNTRNCGVARLRIEVTGAGATALQFVKAKSCFIDDVYILMSATNNVGFHLKAERNGGTFSGCFYNNISKLRILGSDHTDGHTGVLLSGTASDGQCNANYFYGITVAEVDIGVNVQMGAGNSFYGLTTELCNTNGILFDNTSFTNKVWGFYLEQCGVAAVQANVNTTYNTVECEVVTPGALGGTRFSLDGNRNTATYHGSTESSGTNVYRSNAKIVSTLRDIIQYQDVNDLYFAGIDSTNTTYFGTTGSIRSCFTQKGAFYEAVSATQTVSTTGIEIDTTTYQINRLEFTGNPGAGTITAPASGQFDGQHLTLQLSQDVVGGRTVTQASFSTEFQFAGGSYTLGTASGYRDILRFIRINSKWREVSRASNIL